jgi:hypothetical protein
MVLSTKSMPRSYNEDDWDNQVRSVWEAVKKKDTLKTAAIQKGLKRGI